MLQCLNNTSTLVLSFLHYYLKLKLIYSMLLMLKGVGLRLRLTLLFTSHKNLTCDQVVLLRTALCETKSVPTEREEE